MLRGWPRTSHARRSLTAGSAVRRVQRDGDATGSVVSLERLFQDRLVERQIRHDLLQPPVLELEFLQPLRFVGLHAAILVTLAMECLLADRELLTDFANRLA